MPSKPRKQKLEATSPQILNAIRKEASASYQAQVPLADGNDISTLKSIGTVIMNFEPIKNEFLNALINRIAFVRITNQLYYNPWEFFKKGLIETGETVEEVFTQLASPHNFDPDVAEREVFKREIPDVKAAFHTMNYQQFYKQTISDDQLRQAFLSWSGVTDMIASIVNAIYTGANQDEFLTMKYMIQRAYLDGNIKTVTIPTLTGENVKPAVSQVKALSNTLTFMSDQYNAAGVTTFTPNTEQIVLLDTLADALIDVELLAGAFNLPYANLIQQRVLVNDFTTNDYNRLNKLFAKDPLYKPFTQEEVAKLKQIQMCVLDKDWFMIFDNLNKFTEQYNAQGLYWNYFFHAWRTFSYSPFKNAVMLISEEAGVAGITVTPDAANVNLGESANFTATVTGTTNPADVAWSLSITHPQPGVMATPAILSTISDDGIVTVAENEPNRVLYAIATSKTNANVFGYAVINVVQPPKITGINISPSTVLLKPGESQTFSISVTGTPSANLEYVVEVSGQSSNTTTWQNDRLTLGMDEGATTILVKAISVEDPSFTAIAVVTVNATPKSHTLINGATVQSKQIEVKAGEEVTPVTLTAVVNGITDKSVTWSVPENHPGLVFSSLTGTNTVTVDFTESEMVSGTYAVTATAADGYSHATYYFQIAVPPAIIITPAEQALTGAGTVTYTVTPYGITSPAYTWSVEGSPANITIADGVVTVASGATGGTYTIKCVETSENVEAVATLNLTMELEPTNLRVVSSVKVLDITPQVFFFYTDNQSINPTITAVDSANQDVTISKPLQSGQAVAVLEGVLSKNVVTSTRAVAFQYRCVGGKGDSFSVARTTFTAGGEGYKPSNVQMDVYSKKPRIWRFGSTATSDTIGLIKTSTGVTMTLSLEAFNTTINDIYPILIIGGNERYLAPKIQATTTVSYTFKFDDIKQKVTEYGEFFPGVHLIGFRYTVDGYGLISQVVVPIQVD